MRLVGDAPRTGAGMTILAAYAALSALATLLLLALLSKAGRP
jgi:hypothetical protein